MGPTSTNDNRTPFGLGDVARHLRVEHLAVERRGAARCRSSGSPRGSRRSTASVAPFSGGRDTRQRRAENCRMRAFECCWHHVSRRPPKVLCVHAMDRTPTIHRIEQRCIRRRSGTAARRASSRPLRRPGAVGRRRPQPDRGHGRHHHPRRPTASASPWAAHRLLDRGGERPEGLQHGRRPVRAGRGAVPVGRPHDSASTRRQMDEELRWPAFTARAERGINAVLSSPLFLDDGVRGALNVYSTRSWAFGGSERATASAFAAQASVVLQAAARTATASGSALERRLPGAAAGARGRGVRQELLDLDVADVRRELP